MRIALILAAATRPEAAPRRAARTSRCTLPPNTPKAMVTCAGGAPTGIDLKGLVTFREWEPGGGERSQWLGWKNGALQKDDMRCCDPALDDYVNFANVGDGRPQWDVTFSDR
jgi:hypothetical protein